MCKKSAIFASTLTRLGAIHPNNLCSSIYSHCKAKLHAQYFSETIDLERINSAHIITRFDRKKRNLYVNNAIEIYTGLPASFYIGKTNDNLGIDEKLCTLWNETIDKVFAIGFPITIEYIYEGSIGTYRFQSTIIPERKSTGYFHTVLGITRLAENREHTSTLD